jgi:hypothetical protein
MSGFPYVTTTGALSWWDPVTGAAAWSRAVGAQLGPVAFATDTVAWVVADGVATAAVSAAGLGDIWRAPVVGAVAGLRYAPESPHVLWLAAGGNRLHRLIPSESEAGVLCYVDRDNSGDSVGAPIFVDSGSLSNPTLRIDRSGVAGCPGLDATGGWRVAYEVSPSRWQDLTVTSATTIEDMPGGTYIRTGDILETSDRSYVVAATSPLRFEPPIEATVRGKLIPAGRWAVESGRLGLVGFVATGESLETRALALTIVPGVDAPDRGDLFSFVVADGVTPFSTTVEFSDWEYFAGTRVLLVDRKLGGIQVVDSASNAVVRTLR